MYFIVQKGFTISFSYDKILVKITHFERIWEKTMEIVKVKVIAKIDKKPVESGFSKIFTQVAKDFGYYKNENFCIAQFRKDFLFFCNSIHSQLFTTKEQLFIPKISSKEIKRVIKTKNKYSPRASLILMLFKNFIVFWKEKNLKSIKISVALILNHKYSNTLMQPTINAINTLANRDLYRKECEFFIREMPKLDEPKDTLENYLNSTRTYKITREDWGYRNEK